VDGYRGAKRSREEELKDSKTLPIQELSLTFSAQIPPDEFSTAELQGYLLGFKDDPEGAATGISAWVGQERIERKLKAERAAARKQQSAEAQRKYRATLDAAIPIQPSMPAPTSNDNASPEGQVVPGSPVSSNGSEVSVVPPYPSPAYTSDGPVNTGTTANEDPVVAQASAET
jgi:hypothetical protein